MVVLGGGAVSYERGTPVGVVFCQGGSRGQRETSIETNTAANRDSSQFENERFHRNVQRFRDGLVFKAHRLWVSLNSRLESNEEEENTAAMLFPKPNLFRQKETCIETRSLYSLSVNGTFLVPLMAVGQSRV